MANTEIKTLSTAQVSGTGQTTDYRQLIAIGDNRLRIRIRTDSHPSQGHAVIELWRDGWREVWSLDPLLTKTDPKLGYRRAEPTAADYRADVDDLIGMAVNILKTPGRA
jgi:hypothetical protein